MRKLIYISLLLVGCQSVWYVAVQPDGYVVVGKHIRWADSCYVGNFDTIPDLYNQYRRAGINEFLKEAK